jgi:hypothetical protein
MTIMAAMDKAAAMDAVQTMKTVMNAVMSAVCRPAETVIWIPERNVMRDLKAVTTALPPAKCW